MAKFGKLDEFDVTKESFGNYVERTEQYFTANDIKNEKKVAVFLSVIGATTYGTLKNLCQPTLPKEITYDNLIKLLKEHFSPKPLVISVRFKFNKRNQRDNESINDYVVELRRLATHCEFEGFLKEALRDRLVCGLRSEEIQKRLLSQAKLDFDAAVLIATGMETAAKDTQSFGGSDVHYTGSARGAASKFKHRQAAFNEQPTRCFRCGASHSSEACKFKDSTCFSCSKKGHISRKCPNKKKRPVKRSIKPRNM